MASDFTMRRYARAVCAVVVSVGGQSVCLSVSLSQAGTQKQSHTIAQSTLVF